MKDSYIQDTAISMLDDEITKLVEVIKSRPFEGVPSYSIAIQNNEGAVYRVIMVDFSSYINLTQKIPDLGFTDLYKDKIGNKYDSLFIPI